MANTILLKRKIKTAQNVSKTTRAMQMIAASKLKRAQEATLASRPYVEKLTQLGQSLTAKIDKEQLHPYMNVPKDVINKTLLIIFSPDKGLCGGLVTNLIREYLKLESKNLYLITIGKKIEKTATNPGNETIASFNFGNTLPKFDAVYPISKIIDDYFLNKKVDRVQILYSHFSGIFTQKPILATILPISLPEEQTNAPVFSIFEPSIPEIIPNLLRHYLEMVIYQFLLESFVSEQASRMVAMQNATDNAKDIIEMFTLEYNKARQEKITNEILDISSASLFAYA